MQEASETPPPSVWAGIEARLDKDEEKVIPLWWQSPKMWYAAASIVALMLVGGGLWYSGIEKTGVQVAVSTKPVEKPAVPAGKAAPVETAAPGLNKPETARPADDNTAIAARRSGNAAARKPENVLGKVHEPAAEPATVATATVPQNAAAKGTSNSLIAETGVPTTLPAEIASSKIAGTSNAAADENQPISAQLLASLPYSNLDVYMQKRIVFFRPEVRNEEPVKVSKPKEYYAGVGIMPASFNPDVQLKEAPMAFSAQSVSQKRAVTGSSQARASYAVQTQGGVRLSKHWSVETGVSYLRGNSAYEGGGYMLNAYNSMAANVLENALAGMPAAAANSDKSANFDNGALYIDVAKKVSNNYQYLQLPVQAGFTLNPEKKFSYSVLGGMMANFFLANELESASGDIIRTTASDEIYRGMNWAATTGLRLNYKLSANWGANLTGSYQRAVSSGFKSNQSLDSHPYLYGVSWSVRYSF